MNFSFPMEPALWVALVTAVVDLAIAFGAPISMDQKAAIVGAVSAVLAVVGGFVVRSQVTPVAAAASAPPPKA